MPTVSRPRPSPDVESPGIDELPHDGSDGPSPKRRAILTGAVTIAIVLGIAALVLLPGRDDSTTPTSAPPPAAATVPATPTVSMSPPDATAMCTATWTADSGGNPIRQYLVQTEQASTAPSPDGVDVGAPARAIRTPDTAGSFPLGSSVVVAARIAIGTGARSTPVVCGG